MYNAIDDHTLNSKVFVAMTDELLYEHPEKIDGPLVPYVTSVDCHHWLSIEINPDDVKPFNSEEIAA